MLFPFDKRLLSLKRLPKDYAVSVINDIKRLKFTGYLLLLGDNLSHAITFVNGQELSRISSAYSGQVIRHNQEPFDFEHNLEKDIDIEMLSADEGAVAIMDIYFRGEVIWQDNTENGTSAILSAATDFDVAVLSHFNKGVYELALLEQGEISVGYNFDFAGKSFKRVDASFLALPENPDARLELVPATNLLPKIKLDLPKDPLDITIDKYIQVLKFAEDILKSHLGDDYLALIDSIIESMKQKYPPLYRGLYRNPESLEINWLQLLKNRNRVANEYRYDKFPLYMDEVLIKYIRFVFDKCSQNGLDKLRQDIEHLRHISADRDLPPIRRFFLKLSKVTKAV